MKTRKPFYQVATVVVMVALVSSQGPAVSGEHAHTTTSLSFTRHPIDTSFTIAGAAYSADLDEDGDIDVIGGAWSGAGLAWWENNGSGGFTKHPLYASAVREVYATDVNGDGHIDILRAGYDWISWYENDGNGGFTSRSVGSFYGAWSVHAADLDKDGDTDVVGTSHGGGAYNAGRVAWWENDGHQTFTRHILTGSDAGRDQHGVFATDLDSDGDVDILCAVGYPHWQAYWFENDGHANFIAKHVIGSASESIYAIDIDGDQDVDVLTPGWLGENNGMQEFTWQDIGYGGMAVYPVDLDSDGDMDVISEYAWNENDGNENFTPHVFSEDSLADVHIIHAADLDDDRDLDIVAPDANANDSLVWWESNASDLGTIDGHVRYFGPPGILPLANVQVSVDPPRTDSTLTDADGEFSLHVPQDTYVVTGTTEGYVVASSVEARTVTVTPGETAWVGFTMIDESGASGCWTPNQACANEVANIIPILGLGSEVTGVVNGLCEVGRLWEEKRYLWSVTALISTLADIADVVLLDIPTFDWLDALAECGVHHFKELTEGWSISRIIESIWRSGAQDSDVLVVGVEVETNNSVAAQASSASATLQVHLYSGDNHLGLKPDGTLEHTIPRSFLFEWPDNVYEVAIVKGATAQYELQIKGQGIATYNLSVVNPRPDGTGTLLDYRALTVNDGSIASLTLGQSTTDFTLEVDTDGDGNVDDYVEPDSTEHVWPATLYLPVVLRNC